MKPVICNRMLLSSTMMMVCACVSHKTGVQMWWYARNANRFVFRSVNPRTTHSSYLLATESANDLLFTTMLHYYIGWKTMTTRYTNLSDSKCHSLRVSMSMCQYVGRHRPLNALSLHYLYRLLSSPSKSLSSVSLLLYYRVHSMISLPHFLFIAMYQSSIRSSYAHCSLYSVSDWSRIACMSAEHLQSRTTTHCANARTHITYMAYGTDAGPNLFSFFIFVRIHPVPDVGQQVSRNRRMQHVRIVYLSWSIAYFRNNNPNRTVLHNNMRRTRLEAKGNIRIISLAMFEALILNANRKHSESKFHE